MGLRGEVALAIALVGAVVAGVLFGVTAPQMNRTFLGIERTDVRRNVDRARNAIASELTALESTIHDWAAWDDTVQFVEGTAPGYAGANLFADTFVNLRLNDMVFYDAAGRLVDARGFNLEQDEPVIPSESQIAALAPLVAQSRGTESVSGRAGLLAVGGELALVSWGTSVGQDNCMFPS